MKLRRRRIPVFWTPWPVLAGATFAISAGAPRVGGAGGGGALADALIVIGAVLVGGWLVMLAGHGYHGESVPDHDDEQERDRGQQVDHQQDPADQ